MKLKKILSFFLIVISVFIISFLVLNFSKKIENNIVKSNATKVSSNIAIVNQDTGVEKGDKYINYSEKIIENLDSKYIVTSREIAKKGLKNGEFSALIVFPGKFSDNVTSINNENPEKAQFYFELSPKLSNAEKAETEESITKLEREINDKISYIYVANILNEFHDSQDKVIDVLENDNEQVKKILSINDNDLVKSINIRDFEKLKIDINTLNLDYDFNKNQKIMEDMDSNYKKFLSEGNDDLNKIKSKANDLIIKEGGLLSFLGNIANINVLPGYFNGIQFKDIIENFQDKFEKLFTTTSNDIKEYQDNQIEDLSKNTRENLNNNNEALTKQVTEISKNINDIGDASNKMLEEIYKPLEEYINGIEPSIKETKIIPPQLSISAYNSMYENIEKSISFIFDNEIPKNLAILNEDVEALKAENRINALISEIAITSLLNGEPTTQESFKNLVKEEIIKKGIDITPIINNLKDDKIKDLDGYLNYILNKNPNIQPRNEKSTPIEFGLKQFELAERFNNFKINHDSIRLEDYKNLILRDIDEKLKNFDKIENEKLKEAMNFYNERYESIKKSYVGQVDSIKENLIGEISEEIGNKWNINEIKKLNHNLINDIINKLTNEDNENKGFMTKIKDSVSNIFGTLVNSSDKSISDTSDLLDTNIETKEEILKNENITYMSGIREFIRGTELDTKEDLKKSFMEKQEPLAKLNGEIDKYNPIDYITKNQSVFNNLIGDYNQNNSDISKKISEQDQKNIKFTEETYEKADEHVEQLKEDVLKTKEESEKLITDGLKDTKEVSINNTKENKKLMESFSNKLPYTRIGSLSNLKMYDFIATPLEAINTTNNNTEIKSSNSVVATSSKSNSDNYKKYILVGSLILVIFLIIGTKMVITYLKRKDKVENE
ncbi:hypothetical protein GNF85_11255 [Clostridium perfringens]